MTFSLIARDTGTGAFGIVVSSSSPAVAARCAHLAPGIGAVASQNVTNPALGLRGLRLLGLAVVEDVERRVTDLRVDDHDAPLTELERLLGVWLPQKADYRARGIDPTAAPSYGVPGDQ
jgi:uncharacterized Ntn-hydrolase superfamily protein